MLPSQAQVCHLQGRKKTEVHGCISPLPPQNTLSQNIVTLLLSTRGRKHAQGATQAKPSLNEQLSVGFHTLTNITHPSSSEKHACVKLS